VEKPTSVEAYVKSLPDEQRPLQQLRETIAAAAPEADGGIIYSMPGFLLGGHGLVAYAAFDDRYSFFPLSSERCDRTSRISKRSRSRRKTPRAHSETGYRLGSDRGSPNHGSTLLSKRVTEQIRSPVRVRTRSPVPWRMPVEARR
jgi:hypothetical protein